MTSKCLGRFFDIVTVKSMWHFNKTHLDELPQCVPLQRNGVVMDEQLIRTKDEFRYTFCKLGAHQAEAFNKAVEPYYQVKSAQETEMPIEGTMGTTMTRVEYILIPTEKTCTLQLLFLANGLGVDVTVLA